MSKNTKKNDKNIDEKEVSAEVKESGKNYKKEEKKTTGALTLNKPYFDAKKITMLGVFTAMCYAVTFLSHFAPPVFSDFLRLDFKDALIAICGFILGPVEALIVIVITSLIEMVTISTTAYYGLIMNIVSSTSFALVAIIIYRRNRTMANAIGSLICGVASQIIVMMLWNYIITPLYFHMPRAAVVPMLLPIFLPFNAIKGFFNLALALLIYAPLKNALLKAKLIPKNETKSTIKFECVFFSVFILITCTLIVLIQNKII